MENIHTNGPTVYAMERYALVDAVPGNDAVTPYLFADTSCTKGIGALRSVMFATNAVGNGVGDLRLPLSAVAGFHGATKGIIWRLAGDTGASYDTACSTVVLD